MECPNCRARWTIVDPPSPNDEICPNCGHAGNTYSKDGLTGLTLTAVGPPRRSGIPSEHRYIRSVVGKYRESLENFKRTLDSMEWGFVRSRVEDEISSVKDFYEFLRMTGCFPKE